MILTGNEHFPLRPDVRMIIIMIRLPSTNYFCSTCITTRIRHMQNVSLENKYELHFYYYFFEKEKNIYMCSLWQ